jgi:Cysteine-rich CPXCG
VLEFLDLHCPYCGETFETSADLSGGDQDYVEDCAVCCRPIVVRLRVDTQDGLVEFSARREQD